MSNKITRYGHKSDSQIIDSLRAENDALKERVVTLEKLQGTALIESLRAEVERLKGDFNIETLKQIVVALGCEANELRQQLEKAEADRDCWYEQSELLQHQNDEAFAELRSHIDEQEKQLATSQLEVERLREAIFDMAGEAPAYSWKVAKKIEALSPPTSTDALDAYVAEKVQDKYRTLRPYNGRAMSAQEHDEAVEELTRQRDLAVSAATKARNGAQQAAMVCSKKLHVYPALLNMIDVVDDALATIKESEV